MVWLSESDSPTRKYRFTWELVEADLGQGPTLVGINTGHPNKLVAEASPRGRIKALAGYPALRREVKYGKNSRIDLLLECAKKGLCYVEIKNVHLSRRHGLAEFPDSVTERGIKHLAELSDMVRAGPSRRDDLPDPAGRRAGACRSPATSTPTMAPPSMRPSPPAWRPSRCAAA